MKGNDSSSVHDKLRIAHLRNNSEIFYRVFHAYALNTLSKCAPAYAHVKTTMNKGVCSDRLVIYDESEFYTSHSSVRGKNK